MFRRSHSSQLWSICSQLWFNLREGDGEVSIFLLGYFYFSKLYGTANKQACKKLQEIKMDGTWLYILYHETTIKECMRMVDGIFANIFNPWSVRFPFANHLRTGFRNSFWFDSGGGVLASSKLLVQKVLMYFFLIFFLIRVVWKSEIH